MILLLFFLFLTRWIFYRLELDPRINTLCFFAESFLSLLIYGMCIFHVPLKVPLVLLFFGSALLCVLYRVGEDFSFPDFFQPLVFLPLYLFQISQSDLKKSSNSKSFITLQSTFINIFPWVMLGLIVYSINKVKILLTADFFYCMVLSIFICSIYVLIIMSTRHNKSKKTTKKSYYPIRRTRQLFLFSTAMMLCTGFYLAIKQQYSSSHTLSILWATNLYLLYDNNHPMVCDFADLIHKKMCLFLNGNNVVK